MDRLLELLKDGHARTTDMLAAELGTTPADIRRKLEFLENMGIIKKVSFPDPACASCSSCGGCQGDGKKKACSSCIPGGELLNMGEMWEVAFPGPEKENRHPSMP